MRKKPYSVSGNKGPRAICGPKRGQENEGIEKLKQEPV
jgi:hypothetical protein